MRNSLSRARRWQCSQGRGSETHGWQAKKHRTSIEDIGLLVAGLASDLRKVEYGETVYVDGGYHIMG
jgi:enoyl-[acyl-carrier-protein] reductase (NADH)